ncbi:6-bladed beta-propeller [Geothermobacter hydrogeniphilus]|nr:6-bladed beta-propeller [Geothermobacter hydrogeniphilus]
MGTIADHGNCRETCLPAIIASLIVFLLLSVLTGCSPPKNKPRYIWPVPPEQARVEYLQTIYRPEDLQLQPDSLSKALLGRQEPLFQTPFDLLTDRRGRLVVSDSRAGLLWVLTRRGKVTSLPANGKRLHLPLGIAEDSDGRLYVAEGTEKRITVLNPAGEIERRIGEDIFSGNPSFLAIARHRKLLYASDTRNHQVLVFTCGGEYLRTIGTPGTGPGELAAPQGLAVNNKGELLVADMLNSRLSVFGPDGGFRRTIPFTGWEAYYFNSPKGITIGSDGTLWITDQRVGALVAYSREEKPEMVIGAGHMSAHPMAFVAPSGVSVTSNGSLWIADILMRRLSHWQQLTPSYLAVHPFDEATRRRLAAYGRHPRQASRE